MQPPLGLPPSQRPKSGPGARPFRPSANLLRKIKDDETDAPVGKRPGRGNKVEVTPARREVLHVAPLDELAKVACDVAWKVERGVLDEGKRADRAIAQELRLRRDLALPDHRFVSRAVFALFRWAGWIDTLHLDRIEARMLLAWLLDSTQVHPVCRIWARNLEKDPSRLVPVGDAPNWTARADGWKRLNEGRVVVGDPWKLFPDWLRDQLPLPPGVGTPKLRFLQFLESLQKPAPLWVRAQVAEPDVLWKELTAAGIKPWIHRKLTFAAKVENDADLHHIPAFERGDLEIQDLAAQFVGMVCDPDSGERWWDVCAGAGGKAIHLAAMMKGKGQVIASDVNENRIKEAVRRARRSPFRNITTKHWDGKHVVGKSGKYDGVLVDAPCSAIGTWRRNPDARWSLRKDAIARLAETQLQILGLGSKGVRPGGTLVYSVCTVTLAETRNVVAAFLAAHPEFQLDPFPHPVTGLATDGTLQVWPHEADSDAMYIARFVRSNAPPLAKKAEPPTPEPETPEPPTPEPETPEPSRSVD